MNALIILIFVCAMYPRNALLITFRHHQCHLGTPCRSSGEKVHITLCPQPSQSFNERAMLSDHEKTSPRLCVCNDARSCKHTHTNHDDSWIHDGIYFFFELTRPRTEWCWCIVDVSCFSLECESITRSSSQTYCQETKLIKVEITRILWRGWFSSVYIYID